MNCPICENKMRNFIFVNTYDEDLFQCRKCKFTYRFYNQDLTISIKSFHFLIKYNYLYDKEKENKIKEKILHRINVERFYLGKLNLSSLEFGAFNETRRR